MIEIWAVVVLVVGVILAFVGAMSAQSAAHIRAPVKALQEGHQNHEQRLGYLERQDAVRGEQNEAILDAINRVEEMVRRHEDKEPRA